MNTESRKRKLRNSNPEKYLILKRRERMRYKYGITPEEKIAMLERCGWKCEACSVPLIAWGNKTRPANVACIDHDHSSRVVRGILCVRCNAAVGYMRESKDIAMKIARYLETRCGAYVYNRIADDEDGQ